jgi:hypothetical protein
MRTTSSAARKGRVAIWGIALLCAFAIAGCLVDEVEDNGSCNFGGPSTACIPDATHNRLNYPAITGGRGSVHQTLGADSDPVDLWVFNSKVSGSQNLYAKAQHGCATVFLRECWFEPCDPGTLWHEAWQTIWYTDVCEGDGNKLIGSFDATANNHFLVGIADWTLEEHETVNYQFSIAAP